MKKRLILSIIAVLLIVACGTKVSELTDSLTKPLSPIGLKVDSSTDTSVTLSWSVANTATSILTTGYTIESATSEDFTKNSNKITETNTIATVKDLTKGLTYYFRVVANNSKADLSSAPSNVVSQVVEKSTDDGMPSSSSATKPMLSDITIEKNTDGKIVISWKATPGKDDDGHPEAITKYLIKIALNHQSELDSTTPIEVDASSQTSYVVQQPPVAGITYWASVQAMTANTNTAFIRSDVIVKSYTESTAPTIAAKPVVEDVNLEKKGNGNITLTWTSKDGKNDDGTRADVTKFLVRTAMTEAGLASATIHEVDVTSVFAYTITTSPVAGTTYWADVQAETHNSNATFAKSDVVVKSYTERAPIYPAAHKFTHSGHTYYIVNTPMTWTDAASDAVSNGGYLVHVNNQAEQNAIKTAIIASGFTFDQRASDGGGSMYIWLGATDVATEGTWVWNGDNTGSTEPLGTGSIGYDHNANPPGPVNTWSTAAGAYQNWGIDTSTNEQAEPDNSGPQHYAGMSLDGWPLGEPYQWNDIAGTNTMPYIVEVE